MNVLKNTYKVVRSILFSTIVVVVVLYLLLYILLSLPPVQNYIKYTAEKELSALTGGDFSIGKVEIFPFNEIVLSDVLIKDPDKNKLLSADKIGAGIELLTFIKNRKIVITYAELLAPDLRLSQATPDSPLNIQFLIDAFSSKDKNKPSTKIDLAINSVIIRKGALSFDKLWITGIFQRDKFNSSHIRLTDLNADIYIPVIRNDEFVIDLRRIAFNSGSFSVKKIGGKFHVTPTSVSIKNLIVKLPGTELQPSDINLNFKGLKQLSKQFQISENFIPYTPSNEDIISIYIVDGKVTPSDFSFFLPQLKGLSFPFTV
ncbi:MAG: hypothetical protein K2N03_05605, partial [Muribaculaceae bacterium]|nr:hypothetical protein [Muribaculaceae bacterium]